MSQFIEMFGDTHMRSDYSRQWKEVVEIINGKDYKSIQVEDGGYPVYGTGGEMARVSDYLSPANSILLGRKGTIDKPLLIREKYWNVDTAFGAVPDEKVLHYVYFYWHCKTIDFNVLNKGTTLPSTTKVDLLNLWIKIPSMEEQTRFASIVEQADKSEFVGFKSQFIEMFAFQDLSLTNPSDDFAKKCYDDTSSATKVPAGNYQNNGRYAIYDQSQDCDIAGYTDSIEGVCNNYPAVLFGDHSRVIKYINQPFYIGADGVKIIRPKGDDLLPEFLYYDLLYHNIPNTGYNRHFKYVKMMKLTEASIDEQEEFLKIAHQADKSEYYT